MAKRPTRNSTDPAARPCPCGTGQPYAQCCGPLHTGEADATTAQALMRSRFSAFAVDNPAYLLRTWHPTTRPARLHLNPAQRWTRLEILNTDRGGLFDTTGAVAFRAHYRQSGQPGTLTEHSRFVREGGRWAYLDALPD